MCGNVLGWSIILHLLTRHQERCQQLALALESSTAGIIIILIIIIIVIILIDVDVHVDMDAVLLPLLGWLWRPTSLSASPPCSPFTLPRVAHGERAKITMKH